MLYNLVNYGEESNITVFVPGGDPPMLVAHSSHPNWEAIVAAVVTGDADPQDIAELFDVGKAVESRFRKLSERVSVNGGRIYFDGDEVDTSLTRQVLRFLDENEDDWRPLVAFFENVAANSNDHSRQQLYDWLSNRQGITITTDGQIVGYKGVTTDGNGGFVSLHSGTAIVDGETVRGAIPNAVGSVIEMPRSEVAHDPGAACSYGLHVGTYEYAKSYARGAMLRVTVNPRDVVSVPTDAGGEKIRVCRYKVEEIIDAPITTAVYRDPDEGLDDDPFFGEDDYDDYEEDEPGYGEGLYVGANVIDYDDDAGVIVSGPDVYGDYVVNYGGSVGKCTMAPDDLRLAS